MKNNCKRNGVPRIIDTYTLTEISKILLFEYLKIAKMVPNIIPKNAAKIE